MMRTFVAAFALAFAGSPLAAAVAAEPAPAGPAHALPRSLVFAVQYSERAEQRTATSGLKNSDFSGSAFPSSATNTNQTLANGDGTVRVDVVAVPADGIVVDIAEGTRERAGTPHRIGIALDGKLIYDGAKIELSPEEIEILQLCNRALVEGHDEDGAVWTADRGANGTKDRTEYRIVSSYPGPVVSISLERTVSTVVAARPLDMTETGTVRYDEVKTIPLEATLRARRMSHQAGQVTTVDSTLTFRLVSDSWHPKG